MYNQMTRYNLMNSFIGQTDFLHLSLTTLLIVLVWCRCQILNYHHHPYLNMYIILFYTFDNFMWIMLACSLQTHMFRRYVSTKKCNSCCFLFFFSRSCNFIPSHTQWSKYGLFSTMTRGHGQRSTLASVTKASCDTSRFQRETIATSTQKRPLDNANSEPTNNCIWSLIRVITIIT